MPCCCCTKTTSYQAPGSSGSMYMLHVTDEYPYVDRCGIFPIRSFVYFYVLLLQPVLLFSSPFWSKTKHAAVVGSRRSDDPSTSTSSRHHTGVAIFSFARSVARSRSILIKSPLLLCGTSMCSFMIIRFPRLQHRSPIVWSETQQQPTAETAILVRSLLLARLSCVYPTYGE